MCVSGGEGWQWDGWACVGGCVGPRRCRVLPPPPLSLCPPPLFFPCLPPWPGAVRGAPARGGGRGPAGVGRVRCGTPAWPSATAGGRLPAGGDPACPAGARGRARAAAAVRPPPLPCISARTEWGGEGVSWRWAGRQGQVSGASLVRHRHLTSWRLGQVCHPCLLPSLPSPPPPPSPPTAYSPAAVATRCSTPLPSRESGRGRCCCIPWSRRGWLERCGGGGGERPSSAAPS